jgi:hypothetical protein
MEKITIDEINTDLAKFINDDFDCHQLLWANPKDYRSVQSIRFYDPKNVDILLTECKENIKKNKEQFNDIILEYSKKLYESYIKTLDVRKELYESDKGGFFTKIP